MFPECSKFFRYFTPLHSLQKKKEKKRKKDDDDLVRQEDKRAKLRSEEEGTAKKKEVKKCDTRMKISMNSIEVLFSFNCIHIYFIMKGIKLEIFLREWKVKG